MDLAAADFDGALALTPSPGLLVNRGIVHQRSGNSAAARTAFDAALALDVRSFSALYNRGNSYAAEGAYEQALADYSAALAIQPTAETQHNRANALAALGRSEEALKGYDAAITLDPANALYAANRAKLREAMGLPNGG